MSAAFMGPGSASVICQLYIRRLPIAHVSYIFIFYRKIDKNKFILKSIINVLDIDEAFDTIPYFSIKQTDIFLFISTSTNNKIIFYNKLKFSYKSMHTPIIQFKITVNLSTSTMVSINITSDKTLRPRKIICVFQVTRQHL